MRNSNNILTGVIKEVNFRHVTITVEEYEVRIPKEQVPFVDTLNVNEGVKLYKEYNHHFETSFYSIIHDSFSVNSVREFTIEKLFSDEEDKFYFKLKSLFFNLKVHAPKWQHNNKEVKCKVINYKKGIPRLLNITEHPDYKVKTRVIVTIKKIIEKYEKKYYEFTLKDFSEPFQIISYPEQELKVDDSLEVIVRKYNSGLPQFENIQHPIYEFDKIYKLPITGYDSTNSKKGEVIDLIKVELDKGLESSFWHRDWQSKSYWNHKDIKCQVIGYTFDGSPKFQTLDDRHPFLQVGNSYDFKIIDFSKIDDYENIILSDEYDLKYRVSALPGQFQTLKKGEKISCKVESIGRYVELWQVDIKDPFFKSFSEIISNTNYEKEYFSKIIDDYVKTKEQYNNSSAFWILSYCSFVLPNLFYKFNFNKDYSRSLEVLDIWEICENWILKSGVLKQLGEKANISSEKAKSELYKIKARKSVLQALNTFKEEEFLDSIKEKDDGLLSLSFYLSICDLQLIDFRKIEDIISTLQCEEHELKRLSNLINKKIHTKYSNFIDFVQNEVTEKQINLLQYQNNWIYIDILINKRIKNMKQINISYSKFLQNQSVIEEDLLIKYKLLFNAFYLLNQTENFDLQFNYKNGNVSIIADELEYNPNISNIEDSFFNDSEEVHQVEINSKNRNGYFIRYKGSTGFLPYKNISTISLKNMTHAHWKLSVKIVHF